MRFDISHPKASPINSGTSCPSPTGRSSQGPAVKLGKLHVEVDEDAPITCFGGLAPVVSLLRQVNAEDVIDDEVKVFRRRRTYAESCHILALTCNLYTGGTCLEDLERLRGDEGVKRILRADSLPDPTTAGDFLRRFASDEALASLVRMNDKLQSNFWRALHKTRRGRKKRRQAIIDIDSHVEPTYGVTKERADFTYKKSYGFHPLLFTLAGTNELLSVINRSGNVVSHDGAADELDRLLPWMREHFDEVLVRGDSAFDQRAIREVCEKHGCYYAFVGVEHKDRPRHADEIESWKPFVPRAKREARKNEQTRKRRKKRRNRKRQRVRERGYRDMQLERQWVGETTYVTRVSEEEIRLVVRKQRIANRQGEPGQQELWTDERYRYVVTNLPKSVSAEQVIDQTYQRCDQENVIEQLGSGVAMWRMPVREFLANSAWMQLARLAWNLGKWLAQRALPEEVVRWEWKRFRRAFVIVSAKVIAHARQVFIRLAGSHREVGLLVKACKCLQR